MTNLRNSLQKVFEQKKSAEQLMRAKEKFAFKTFREQYNSLKNVIRWGRILFHIFSILTAITFLYLLFNPFIKIPVISVCISSFILLFWEYAKSNILEQGFYSYYKGRPSIVLPIIATLMLTGSVFTSLQGTKSYVEMNDTSVQAFKDITKSEGDSIERYYYTRIEAVKEEMNDFKESVKWKGKINIYDGLIKSTLERYNKEITFFSEKLGKDKEKHRKHVGKEIGKLEKESVFNLYSFIILSGINELLIVICTWFLVFYEYKLVRESEIFEPTETYELDSLAINQLVKLVKRSGPNQYLISNEKNIQNPIGFKAATVAPNYPGVTGQNSDFDQVPRDIVQAIKSGIKDPRFLMKTYKLNVIQVNQYLKEYA